MFILKTNSNLLYEQAKKNEYPKIWQKLRDDITEFWDEGMLRHYCWTLMSENY